MLPRIEWSMLMRGSGAVEMARKFFGGSRVARVAVTTAVLAAATIGTGIVQTSATTPAGGALTFDGVNDYVTMGVASSLGATNFTLEAWVNRTGPGATTSTGSLTSVIPILAKGRGEGESPNNLNFNYFLGIDNSTGALVADFEEVTGPNHPVTSTTVVPMNSWHHVAATYDGRIFRLFMDGVLIQSLTVAATPLPPVLPQSASIQHASVGSALNSGGAAAGFFAGQIDEARIWSTARAQSDIQIGMSQEITSGTGLLGRFGFNEGSGATAGNSVAGNPNGTLTNGPTWSSGFPQPSAGDALNMGTSGFVSFGDPAKLDLAQFTIETWFRRSGAGTPNTTGDGGIASFEPLVTHGAPESETGNLNANWLLGISTVNVASPVLAADFEDSNNGLNHPVSGTTVITNNVWHHAAATYDGTTWRLYLDGNLEATEAVPFTLSGSQTPRSDSIQGAGLGAMFTSLGTPLGRFNGSLDEARVWNAARSEADIRSTINNSSLTSGTGLVARWGLGDPVGGAVIDSIGTPANGGVAGVGADRVTGAPFNLTFGDPPLVLVGAGDVADCARTQDEATAALVAGIDGHVFTIGDNVYENGTAAEFANCYDPGWGQFKNRTRPTLGNHDYGNGTTPGATPYFDYFNGVGNQTGPAGERGLGYYSYNIGSGANTWHIVVLNAECEPGTGYWVPGGCAAGSPQDLWLQNDLATSPTNNIIAMWHKPRFSSTGNFPHMQQLYQDLYNGGVELVLGGHWHNYEVLAPMDASGAIDNVYGVRQMVIGTGGVAPTGFGTVLPSSQVRNSVTNGVVKFTLHEDSYDWEFIPIAGQTFTDSGSTVTHDAPPTPTGDALDLGTAGAYVTFGDPAKLDLAQFTLETWFKRTGTGTANTSGSGGIDLIPLVTHGAPESDGSNVDANWIMGINTAGNVLAADFEDTATGANHPVSGTTAIPADGSWHHAAATYDGTTWRLYLDGNLEATSVVGAFTPRSDTTQQAALGTMLTSTGTALGRFVGTLDEARVWNTARTLTDIRATANSELTSGTGLVARWSLGDASGTNVADSIAPTANGTVTGTGATWVNGAPFDLTFDTVAPAAPSGLTANGTVTANDLAWTANAEPDVASYRVYRSTTSPVSIAGAPLATVNAPAVVYADTTAVAGTPYFYVVTAVDGSGNESPASGEATATRLSASGTALQLGTAGAYVTFGDPAELDLGTFTIETWFNRTGTGVSNTTGTNGIENFLPLVTHGGPQSENSNVDANWLLGINTTGNVLAADFEDNAGGTNHPVSGTTAITSNVWHHAAATYDGTTWRLYLDGNLEATLAVNATPRADSIQHAAIGTMLNSSGAPGNTARFHGIIDEARVWSGARNLQQIRTTMNSQLTTGTNLVARWGLEEGTGTAVSDSVAPASNGTITGTGSSWVPGAPFNLVNPNTAPNAPTNPVPANASTNVATSPTLSVDVSDVDNDELQVDFYGRSLGAGDPFTFVVIPDTQHYVDANGANLTHFASQVNWIVDNKDTLDIAFVSHLGDITESFDTVPAEWTRASAQMAVLDAAGVPNNMAPGNHDMLANGTATNYDIHFPPSRYDMNTWYGGYLGDSGDPVPESVDRLNKDNYQLFTAGGIDFLIIHLEVDMPQFTLDWASDVLEQYPNRHAIISTHAFVNTSNNRGTSVIHQTNGTTAAHVWDTVIRNHCNVFMVVNGHYPGEGRRTDNNDCGEPVHQVLTDYQSRTQGGSSWLRYYRFTPATNQIEAFTYATSTNTFETDSDSSFVLPFDMSAAAGFQLIGSTTVPSGSTASVVWNGLDTNQQYEWYAVARDGIASTDGPVSSFTTAAPVNATPTANASAPSVVEDTATPVALSGSDVETCELTFAIVTPPTNGTLGSIGNSACVAGAPNTDSASVTYTPNANFNGADSFTYTVSDGLNTSAPATVSITVSPTNDAPSAVADAYNASEDTVLNVAAPGVLGNDSDVDGPSLTTNLVATTSNGVLVLAPNGSFTYTPNLNFNGVDSFTYQAFDGSLFSSTVTVTITVAGSNDAPTAVADAYNASEDTVLNVAAPGVLGNDSDVDGPSLTANLVATTSNGVLVLAPNGSFTYTPNVNFNGVDSFTYQAFDGSLFSSTVTVTIMVNAAPLDCNGSVVTVDIGLGQVPTAGDDVILGTEGPDVINALGGNDLVCGRGGDDIIDAGDGNDLVFGGAGNDIITGGLGGDQLIGEGDNDTLNGGDGPDYLAGGAGDDTLNGDLDADILDGGSDNDLLQGGRGGDQLFGWDGNDIMWGEAPGFLLGEPDYLWGGTGIDTYNGGVGNDWLAGGDEGETMNGDSGDDIILGFGGDDILNGGSGLDYLWGGTGVDVYNGGDDRDTLDGNDGGENAGEVMNGDGGDDDILGYGGNDTLNGGVGSDYLWGGAGVDTFNGGDDRDHLEGDDEGEVMNGDGGDDLIIGWGGADTLNGGVGSDYLWGGLGVDTFNGGDGADYLDGSDGGEDAGEVMNGDAGDDLIIAWGGDDTLDGGAGADYLWGSSGADVLIGGPDAIDICIDPQSGTFDTSCEAMGLV